MKKITKGQLSINTFTEEATTSGTFFMNTLAEQIENNSTKMEARTLLLRDHNKIVDQMLKLPKDSVEFQKLNTERLSIWGRLNAA
jgi:hypothetical protein